MASDPITTQEFSPRQNAVLDQALRLLVEGGEKALTTSGLARAANCSKESLYKWFGDRDGLLAAMITFQQSKVRTFEKAGDRVSAPQLADHLEVFAHDLLDVLAGMYRWRSIVLPSGRRAATVRSLAICCWNAAVARSIAAPVD